MKELDKIKLENYEDEDISDIIVKLEKSFNIKFDKTAFYEAKTFGDLCDIFDKNIDYQEKGDCTSQQAFYQVRKAIADTQHIREKAIILNSKLATLFPKHNRRKTIREFESRLGIKVDILIYPGWLSFVLGLGLLSSLVAFFFDWKIAATGIIFFACGFRVADWLAKDLELETVEQLVRKITREHYISIRRVANTVNRSEIMEIIVETFNNDLDIDRSNLTRETALR